jgi:thioredoxin
MRTIDEKDFKSTINTGKAYVFICSANWCAPCRTLYPLLDKLDEVYKERVDFYKIDTDECYDLCAELKVSAIPTMIFIVGSQIKSRLMGVQPENKITSNIEELLI